MKLLLLQTTNHHSQK